jgi:hypothetical protein
VTPSLAIDFHEGNVGPGLRGLEATPGRSWCPAPRPALPAPDEGSGGKNCASATLTARKAERIGVAVVMLERKCGVLSPHHEPPPNGQAGWRTTRFEVGEVMIESGNT